MSQPANCNKCKDAGFPDQKITFEKNGTKPDGSIKWKPLNLDGTEHKHKEKVQSPDEVKKRISDLVGDDGIKDLAAAVRELAAAIRERKF